MPRFGLTSNSEQIIIIEGRKGNYGSAVVTFDLVELIYTFLIVSDFEKTIRVNKRDFASFSVLMLNESLIKVTPPSGSSPISCERWAIM